MNQTATPGSPLARLTAEFDSYEQGQWVETLFCSDERRVLLTARGIDSKFAIQTKVDDEEQGYFWKIVSWTSDAETAALWALI